MNRQQVAEYYRQQQLKYFSSNQNYKTAIQNNQFGITIKSEEDFKNHLANKSDTDIIKALQSSLPAWTKKLFNISKSEEDLQLNLNTSFLHKKTKIKNDILLSILFN